MKKEELYEVLGNLDDELVMEAQTSPEKKKKKWIIPAVAAACAGIVCGGVLLLGQLNPLKTATPEGTLLAAAEYPIMAQYPEDFKGDVDYKEYEKRYDEWNHTKIELRYTGRAKKEAFKEFVLNSIHTFVNDNNENLIYSPMSLYMALGMSAEITDGDTRQQILDVLGYDNIEELRKEAGKVWGANYSDDGMAKCLLASSLWTNDKISYNQEVLDVLAKNYYASSYTGNPANPGYSALLQGWLNNQTDGLLDEYVSGIEFDPEMILTLATTVNYNGKWNEKFSKEATKKAVFHAPGNDISCDFMNGTGMNSYYWGDHYSAIEKRLEGNGKMKIILPDEGVNVIDLFSDEQSLAFIFDKYYSVNEKYVKVNISIPKFDVSSDIDMIDGLRELGITDIFDPQKSDCSPLSENIEGVALGKVKHAARVLIDEEGCKASALTAMIYAGSAMPQDEVDFVVDRPFLFEIVSENGYPLFIGVVNNPV